LYNISSFAIASFLSPTLQMIAQSIEIIRLTVNSKSSVNPKKKKNRKNNNDWKNGNNMTQQELWPGVVVDGAAIQCCHCKRSCRRILHSVGDIGKIIENIALNHLATCTSAPKNVKSTINMTISEFSKNDTIKNNFQSEIYIFGRHLLLNLRRNKDISKDIPLISPRSRFKKRGESKITERKSIFCKKTRLSETKAVYVGEIDRFQYTTYVIGPGKTKAFDVREVF